MLIHSMNLSSSFQKSYCEPINLLQLDFWNFEPLLKNFENTYTLQKKIIFKEIQRHS